VQHATPVAGHGESPVFLFVSLSVCPSIYLLSI
jgi:hypothetical protein